MLLLVGCSPYSVSIIPVLPLNEAEVLNDAEEVRLEWLNADGEVFGEEVLNMPSSAQSSRVEGPKEQPAGVLISALNREEVVARGRTGLLKQNAESVNATVLMASTTEIGWLGPVAGGRFGASLTATGNGEFLLMGGMSKTSSEADPVVSNEILGFSISEPSEGLFFTSKGTLPGPLVGHSVTPMGGVDEGKYLIFGGATDWFSVFSDRTANLNDSLDMIVGDVAVYTPETGELEPVESDESWRAGKDRFRAFHQAVAMPDGGVVIWGGWGKDSGYDVPILSYLAPGARTLQDITPAGLAMPGTIAPGATATQEGAIFCGGVSYEADFQATDACILVRSPSSIEQLPPLSAGRVGLSLVELSDSTVLASGGALLCVEGGGEAPQGWLWTGVDASDDARLLKGGQWSNVVLQMDMPRAGHQSVALPDGQVLLYGGANYYAILNLPENFYEDPSIEPDSSSDECYIAQQADENGDPIPPDPLTLSCASVFDPETGAFTELFGCPSATEWPAMASDPVFGAIAVGGLSAPSISSEGVAFFP